ncbi:hypothetical protein ANANG_G00022550 [Anguilla anguilla]|uniref:Apoptosis-stimulating of p53 protein 2-like RA domain-containing protein n=1 Tax=Anguilla anguilla TaxID=7936 RepID=A0A9D3N1S4_ANGAN|nr:hypothetical protein ANANG_G00022550 [Anguilla anguilla]
MSSSLANQNRRRGEWAGLSAAELGPLVCVSGGREVLTGPDLGTGAQPVLTAADHDPDGVPDRQREAADGGPHHPDTTCGDVVEFCKEPGESGCHLAEVWRGNERAIPLDHMMYEHLQKWGPRKQEVKFFLRHPPFSLVSGLAPRRAGKTDQSSQQSQDQSNKKNAANTEKQGQNGRRALLSPPRKSGERRLSVPAPVPPCRKRSRGDQPRRPSSPCARSSSPSVPDTAEGDARVRRGRQAGRQAPLARN